MMLNMWSLGDWNTFFFWSSASSHSSRAFLASQLAGSFSLLSSSTTSWWLSLRASFCGGKYLRFISWESKWIFMKLTLFALTELLVFNVFDTPVCQVMSAQLYHLHTTKQLGRNKGNSPVWNVTLEISAASPLFSGTQHFPSLPPRWQ